MITDNQGRELETFAALVEVVTALDRRFPDGAAVFQRVSRLCEEAGELAQAVNRRESMGLKASKDAPPADAEFAQEVQDVLRAALGLAAHYGLLGDVERSVERSYRRCQRNGDL
jgi:NTP pyrophosphatase (non-canonical NTP hydrolase)